LSYSVFGCIGCLYDFTDGVTHLFADTRFVLEKNIGGAKSLVDRGGNGALNARQDRQRTNIQASWPQSDGADGIRLARSQYPEQSHEPARRIFGANASGGQHASYKHLAFSPAYRRKLLVTTTILRPRISCMARYRRRFSSFTSG
jgi:hypothetical protein